MKKIKKIKKTKETKESKFDIIFKHVLHLDEKELRLKFFFDHVRNYGIAATVMVAGFYLILNGSMMINIDLVGYIFGALLLMFGFMLMVLNLMHPIWAMAKFNVKMLPYMLISLLLFLSASELTWVFINRSMRGA